MDSVSHSMDGGRAMRVFAAVDDRSRRCVVLEFDVALPAKCVTRNLDQTIETYGKPRAIRSDNGPVLAGRAFDALEYVDGIEHPFLRPGIPIESTFVDGFNVRLRGKLFDQRCFYGLRHARGLCEEWGDDDHHVRPHAALCGRSPGQSIAEAPGSPRPSTSMAPAHLRARA